MGPWHSCLRTVKVNRARGREVGYLRMEIERGARLHGVLQGAVRALELTAMCNRKPLKGCEQGPACCDVCFIKIYLANTKI